MPNVFYGSARAPVVDLGDLSRPENRATLFEKPGPLMAALTPGPPHRRQRQVPGTGW